MQTDKEKAAEIRKKRRLAAKGLKQRKDGKPVDPLAEAGTLDLDTEPHEPESTADKQLEIARRGIAVRLGMNRH